MEGWVNQEEYRIKYRTSSILLKIIIILLTFITIISTVSAFGVSAPYFENNTIKLEPGQKFEYTFLIQNAEDITFNVSLRYNSTDNFAILRQKDFFIPQKSYDNQFVFDIIIPNSAKPGQEYILTYYARPLIEGEGQIPLNIEIKRDVTFLVVDEKGIGYKETIMDKISQFFTSKSMLSIYPYLILVVIILILYFIIRRFWAFSKSFSTRIIQGTKIKPHKRPKFPISQAKNLQDITYLITIMPEEQFALPEIKKLISNKLLDLGEAFLSRKVLEVKTTQEMISILK